MTHSERLSVLDAAFLDIETTSSPLHVGAVAIFDGGPLAGADGGVDYERLRRYVAGVIARDPRYRQRVVRTPLLGAPAWIDDEHFVLDFHLRHTRLPAPGDVRQLKRLAGRIFSNRLDRAHPLWETWIVEGLEGGRFALIMKVHHCMIDGVAGANLLTDLLRGTPDDTVLDVAAAPRPAPGALGLLGREIAHRLRGVAQVRRMARAAGAVPGALRHRMRRHVGGIAQLIGQGLTPVTATPFNPRAIGPHRRFDWARFELSDLQEIRRRLGGTVNDVALAIVAGALRRAVVRRGVDPDRLARVRALVPVNVRAPGHGELGNHVALLLPELPVASADPRERLQRITATMTALKDGGGISGTAALEELADAAGAPLIGGLMRLSVRLRAFNVVVTNVAGPPAPLYLLGARLREVYPLVPLFERQSLGVAVFSYARTMFVGVVGDWHQVPDLHDVVGDLEESFAELASVAGLDARAADRAVN